MELNISAIAICITTLLFVARLLIRKVTTRRFMSRSGCKPPPTIDGGFLGIRLAQETNKALQRGDYFSLSRARFRATGKTYQGSALGVGYVATIEPENLKALFTQTTNFRNSGRKTDWWPMMRGGILVSDGDEWKRSRALVQSALVTKRISNLDRLESHVQKLISQIPRDGGAVELQALFMDLTFDTGLGYVLGHHSHSDFEHEQQQLLGHNLQTAMFEAGRRTKIGTLRLLDPVVRPRKFYRYLRACGHLYAYFDRLVGLRMDELSMRKGGMETTDDTQQEEHVTSEKPYIVLDELAKVTQDRVQMRWEVASVLAAARDTTAALLSHVFWELARRPDIWACLRDEVDRLQGRKPTYGQLGDMVYLQALLNESLRMYPPAGIMTRWTAHDVTLPVGGGPDGRGPCFVSGGSRIVISINGLHRRADIWGPDADEFRPERWIVASDGDDTTTIKTMPPWTYMPFSGGTRICPGRHLAMVEAKYTIVRLLQTFDRIEARDQRRYAEEAGITIMLKHGAWVGLWAGEHESQGI